MGRNNKRNGGAVSLYLPSDVKHLHEMASADENMKPSKIYADALRALFGDVDELHPIEHLAQNQLEEIQELEDQLGILREKHEQTSSRIPSALANAFFEKHKLSDAEYRELRQLRSVLWYEVDGTKEITVEITGESCLKRYKELIFRHFATADGPKIGISLHEGDDFHSHFNSHQAPLCTNHDLGECRNMKGSSVQTCDLGTNICDDLKYRCDSCYDIRKSEDPKPIWEVGKVELTIERKKEGLLLGERKAKQNNMRRITIANAKRRWDSLYPVLANELDQLHFEADERPTYKDGVIVPMWKGNNHWPKARSRASIMEAMRANHPEFFEEYKQKEAALVSLNRKQSEFIKQQLSEWEERGMPFVSLDEGSSISAVSDLQTMASSGEITFSIHADLIKRATYNVVVKENGR